MQRHHLRKSAVVAVSALWMLGGCADLKSGMERADRSLRSLFGTSAETAPADSEGVAAIPVPVRAPTAHRGAPPTPLQQAEADWTAGRFDKAVARLRPLAEAGNAEAQYRLGLAHAQGRGVARDPLTALAWWHKAGIQGNPDAQYQLGEAYLAGNGVEEDAGLASAWLARASAREHAGATYRLATLYEAGPDEARRRSALVLLERAAQQGHAEAQVRMGQAYAEGNGVERDPAWAARWFGKAARQGVPAAQARLGDAFAGGEGVPRDVVQAAAWYQAASSAGHAAAAEALAALEETLDEAQRAESERLAKRLTSQPARGYDDAATVLYVQAALAENGLDPGAPDGLLGPATRGALTEWQRAKGLEADGAIGPRVLAALRGVDDTLPQTAQRDEAGN